MIKLIKPSILGLFLCVSVIGRSQKAKDFYTETNTLGITKDFVAGYGGTPNDGNDDSADLQAAIEDMRKQPNGGVITIPEGNYLLSGIVMKSNVHVEIAYKAKIYPTPRTDTKNYSIFAFGGDFGTVINTSIRGVGGKFIVDLRNLQNKNVAVFNFKNVKNFHLSKFNVLDDNTKFSAVTFGYSEHNGNYFVPRHGVILNGKISNAHYGYGLVQMQAGKNILLKYLKGTGGVTLRLETGYDKMNLLQVGGVDQIYGRTISCTNGNAAVMTSPHAIQNGHVDVSDITGISCGFAVRIGAGYTKSDQEAAGLLPGTFKSTSVVTDIHATYGTNAQLKSKHFKYMPCNLVDDIASDFNIDGESYKAPSVAAVIDGSKGTGPGYFNINIEEADVTAVGFASQPKLILHDEDADQCSNSASKNAKKSTNEVQDLIEGVYPNPATDLLNVVLSEDVVGNDLLLLNSLGAVVFKKNVDVNSDKTISVDVSSFISGVYYLTLGNGQTQKIIIQ